MNTSMPTAMCIINEPSCVEDSSSKGLVMNTTLHLSMATERTHTWRWNSHLRLATGNDWCIYSMKGLVSDVHQKHYAVTKCCQLTSHAASLHCIHLWWPHFLSTFQATQYFIRVVRKMCNIYNLALWVSDPHKNWNPGKNFIRAFLWQINVSFSDFIIVFSSHAAQMQYGFKNWFRQAIVGGHKGRLAQKTACGWLCWIGND